MLAVGCLVGAAPALALGGSIAWQGGAELEARTVMVLGSRGSVCTGTVIGPRTILTAGHCVAASKEHAVAYIENGTPVLQAVRSVRIHPGFSRNARVSVDLALVRLAEPLPARFRAVRLDDGGKAHDVGMERTIAGFGLASDGDEKSAGTLRRATVTVVPRHYPRFLRLAADSGTLNVCKGDSGGPVLADASAAPTVIGVVYAAENVQGTRCGRLAQAVRVAPQRGWIDGVLAGWGGG